MLELLLDVLDRVFVLIVYSMLVSEAVSCSFYAVPYPALRRCLRECDAVPNLGCCLPPAAKRRRPVAVRY